MDLCFDTNLLIFFYFENFRQGFGNSLMVIDRILSICVEKSI